MTGMDVRAVCAAYEAMKNAPRDPSVRASYDAFVDAINAQFEAIPVRVVFVPFDPYKSNREMRADIAGGRLLIFTGHSKHPILTPIQNWRFRAAHDYYAHYLPGNSFDTTFGEYHAWLAHRALLPSITRAALSCETRGQSAYYAIHKAYPIQKVGLMPSRFI